ncbi:MAG: DUF1275 domain-containing protein [Proteobacteria bacterium]|nr:MAG: DUF1275 domain-containing protein [Pseudomonadota bacterium]
MPYSHPQPLDRASIYRDWKHILPGAMALSGTAGYINSVVLGFLDTPVSHMSGAVSHLGIAIADNDVSRSTTSTLIILGFLVGAMLAGFLVGATRLTPSRRYGAVLMFEGVLLSISAILLASKSPAGSMLAATACGLQNAMSSSYCGLMIRTTHVSGIVTDLGVMLGHWVRHRRIVIWKLRFLVALLFSFGFGGVVGGVLNRMYGPICLGGAAVGCLLGGMIFWLVMQQQNCIDTEPEDVPKTSIFPNA